MPITNTDTKLRLTNPALSAGNGGAQANPNNSLGKYSSTTDLVDNSLNNLYDNVSGGESAAGMTDYRCLALYNSHATLTWEGVTIWLESDVAGGGTVRMGLDPQGVVAYNSSSAQGATIGSETTPPSGVTFSNPSSGSPLTIGNMGPQTVILIWIERTVAAATSALNNDGSTVHARGDSQA